MNRPGRPEHENTTNPKDLCKMTRLLVSLAPILHNLGKGNQFDNNLTFYDLQLKKESNNVVRSA